MIFDITQNFFEYFFSETLGVSWPQYSQGDLAIKALSGILTELVSIKETGKTWKEAVDLIAGVNAVRMMTIHKSKGLEFEAVILLGFEDYSYFRFGATNKKLDEEKSTIFVALSRAKSRLWISASKLRVHTGNSTFNHINPIISDIVNHGFNKRIVSIVD